MAVIVLALLTINEDEPRALAKYLEVTAPLLEKAGARIVNRFTINEVVVGHRPAKSAVFVEYPDMYACKQVFESAEYKNLEPVRNLAFLSYSISIVSD